MSVRTQSRIKASNEAIDFDSQCALAPNAARVETLDKALRSQLCTSFRYIDECSGGTLKAEGLLEPLEHRLSSTVSPWLFCLYAKLVAQLSKTGDLTGALRDILAATSRPASEGVIALRENSVPTSWWDQFEILFDTDDERPFRPQVAGADAYALCKREIEDGLALLQLADPAWYDELRLLLRMIVIGSGRLDTQQAFNGASTFFFWGGSLINSELRRSAISIIDLLVHESSHLLLFGLSGEGALLDNSGDERYSSPLRADPRPMDGVLHASFVAGRVNLAMCRLLDSGLLSSDDIARALDRKAASEKSTLVGLRVLEEHAKPTARGQSVLATLHSYISTPVHS